MRHTVHFRVVLLLVAALGVCYSQTAGGTITRIAGCGDCAITPDGSPALTSRLSEPSQLAVDSAGTVYFVEDLHGFPGVDFFKAGGRVRKITPDGIVMAFAGTGIDGTTGDGGLAVNATLSEPWGVAVDAAGNVYISERGNGTIRKVTPKGVLSTVTTFTTNATGTDTPEAMAIDAAGNLYVCSYEQVYKVTPAGVITKIAGLRDISGFSGDGGSAVNALLKGANAIAVDAAGSVYISDSGNNRIRKVTPAGIISTVAGNGSMGPSTSPKGDGGPAVAAPLSTPQGVAIDGLGNLYISEDMLRVRKVTPDGIITTVVGRDSHDYYENETAQFCCTGLLATSARVEEPKGIAVDAANNLYIANYANENMILKVTPETYTAGAKPKPTAVVNAADYQALIAPTAWITIMGTDLSPITRGWDATDFVQGALPQQLNGVRVYVAGWPTIVSYISPTQINAMVFHQGDLAPIYLHDSVPVEVITPQARSDPFTVAQNACSPGVFRLPVDQGKWAVAQAYSDGALIAPSGILPGTFTRPAHAGDILTVYGTGYGRTNPPVPAGTLVTTPAVLAGDASFHTEFVTIRPVWAGLVGAGLYQFNFVVPAGIPNGDYKFRPDACGLQGSEAWLTFKQ